MKYIYEFKLEKCLWKNVCQLAKSPRCNGSCLRFMKSDYLLTQSLLTDKQREIPVLKPCKQDLEAFIRLNDIKENINEIVKQGKNILIQSNNCGNGKTSWAIKLLAKYFTNIWHSDSFTVRGLFISVAKMVNAFKDNFNMQVEYAEHIRENILTADIVVWDDIGLKSLTPYEHDLLYSFINNRIDLGKANIFTSNLVDGDLEEAVGKRLYSRISNSSEVITFMGLDRRGGAQ